MEIHSRHLPRMRPALALTFFSVLAGLAIIGGTLGVLWELRTKELARAERDAANLAQILAEQTARAAQSVDLILRSTQERLLRDEASGFLMDEKATHNLLSARIAGIPQVRSLSVFDSGGRLIRTSRVYPAPSVEVGDRDYFVAHLEDSGLGLFVGQPVRSRLDGAWGISFSRRLEGRRGDFRGVITATVDPQYFEDLYQSLNLEGGSDIRLYHQDGRLISSEPHREDAMGKSFEESPLFAALAAPSKGGSRAGLLFPQEPGILLAAYREIVDFPFVVVVTLDRDIALANWRHQAWLIGVGAVGMLAVLAIVAGLLARELARDEALTRALRESEARIHGILHSAMDAVITVNEEQRVVLFNPAAERMFGCRAEEALGSPLDRFIPERYREMHRRHVQAFGHADIDSRTMSDRRDILGRRAGGEEFPIDASISRVEAGGKLLYTAVVRDMTRRRQNEEQLKESHRQLRELSASLQHVREEERTRIARELHDELGQQLTGLKLDLSWMGSRLKEDRSGLLDKIGNMKKTLDATVGAVRRISAELRPLLLDDLGLVPAVEWLRDDFARRTGIAVELSVTGAETEVDHQHATAVFRILQESLTNVARHAEATAVKVSLDIGAAGLRLSIRDNGQGMAPGAQAKRRSFGLIGIRERAIMLGGEASIESPPGEGTVVRVELPMAGATMKEGST